MLEQSEQRVSTGLAALDDVLAGLYWGDNVVWQLDSASAEPFYRAVAEQADAFDARIFVSLSDRTPSLAVAGVKVMRAGPRTRLSHPAELLREIHRVCRPGERRLLLFDSLDLMVQAWGTSSTRGFFSRCCPLLLDVGAIAYWSIGMRDSLASVRDSVESVTQCVLRVDDRSIRVVKAEARGRGVRGSLLHWREENGSAVLAPANINGRVAASLRSLRRARGLSQRQLAKLAGVTASAISQAERAERGLSVGTLAQLSLALGITIDDLLHGDDRETYRIGRRPDDPHHSSDHGSDRITNLLGSASSEPRVDLVHLAPREAVQPRKSREGTGIVAVATGLVQVQVAGQTPAVRSGEVLVAASDRVEGWRNIGQTEASLFWIVQPLAGRGPADDADPL
jgi:transcriptional regulator with XRE-family HTH domain